MIKVVAFGNQQIALDCIHILRRNKQVEIVAVVGCETDKDTKQGYPSLKKFSKELGLKYYNPEKLDGNFFNLFKSLRPDICFGFMYRNVFNRNYLRVPKMGIINFHPSLLPKYRGPIPWVWAMINGEKDAGLTMHYMDEGIDTGDIIAQSSTQIKHHMSGFKLLNKLMGLGVALFREQLPLILEGKNVRIKQDHKGATYFGPFNSNIRIINWFEKSDIILRKINAVTKPYDGAITTILGQEMIIWNAKKVRGPKKNLRGPGKIVKILTDSSFVVSTVDGYLLIYRFDINVRDKNLGNFLKSGNKFS